MKALASGNPKIIEKAGVDAEIAKYSSLFSVWRNERYSNEAEVANLPMRIKSLEQLLVALQSDARAAAEVLTGDLVLMVHGRSCRARDEIGEALRTAIKSALGSIGARASEEAIGTIGSFALCVFIGREVEDVYLYVKGETHHDCRPRQTGPALYATLMETLHGIELRREDVDVRVAQMRSKLSGLIEELARPFERIEESGYCGVESR